MNERIKQLAEDCGLYIAYDNRAVTDAELDFFARQIIAECIKSVEETTPGYRDYRSQIEEQMRSDCADAIMQRFKDES